MKKLCPLGSVFIKAHSKTINGRELYWNAHCRKVKTRKYILNKDEIIEIYRTNETLKLSLPKSYSFNAKHGFLQITDYTLKLIQIDSKELRNHRFKLTRDDLFNPVINVAVAVRWLYRKREIAKYYLKKEPTAIQLAEEYKGIRNDKSIMATKQRNSFKELWRQYRAAK